MDLRVIVAYLDRKRLSARAIHNDIARTLGPNIVGYSTVRRYLREVKFPLSTGKTSNADDRKPIDGTDEAILSALDESPFASVQQLSRLTHLPPMTACRRLNQFLGFAARHLIRCTTLYETCKKLSE
jgi:hypothetical protein